MNRVVILTLALCNLGLSLVVVPLSIEESTAELERVCSCDLGVNNAVTAWPGASW